DPIFHVPLLSSINCAKAIISYMIDDHQHVGFVPVVIAKCGIYLKSQALCTEGIFRINGSKKRVNELYDIFSLPPDFGKSFIWSGYSVHDAANLLRRYLSSLPDPVITHHLYQPFRDVILSNTSIQERVGLFQSLIEQLPPEHFYLLFYILDLLAIFKKNAQYTRMDSSNLASIFAPCLLFRPEHELDPAEYALSKQVIQFLIDHQQEFKVPSSPWYSFMTRQEDEIVPIYTPTRSLSVIIPSPKEQKIKRAKTLPSRSRRDTNDIFQMASSLEVGPSH
ncbi:Rho GTPase activation protein, partial [Pilobolus umbonatus]